MFQRIVKPSETHSFFLFGPRGSGKSTLLQSYFQQENCLRIDLLLDSTESRYSKNPDLLLSDVTAKNYDWVIIDEVQKIPKLLDIVHKCMVEKKIRFALTGSSARRLKRYGSNLLAGRAFLYYLFPLTSSELKSDFQLLEALQWGTLPQIFSYQNTAEKKMFLRSYVQTYLKEEVLQEQLIRNIHGFRDFLEIAAQMNGKSLNFSKIGRECGLDSKTVKEYFQILEDTLIGFWLPAFHSSVRKSQTFQPKFYFHDLGVVHALEGSLDSPPVPGTSSFGQYFEAFFVNEVFRLNTYFQMDFKLSYYQTSHGGEIDLVLSKGRKKILVEIKSTTQVDHQEVLHFERLAQAFHPCEKYYISQDPVSSKISEVHCLHYQEFLKSFFSPSS